MNSIKMKKAPWFLQKYGVKDPVKRFKTIRKTARAKEILGKKYRVDARWFVVESQLRKETCVVVACVPELAGESDKLDQCHHVFGRRGQLLLWTPGWMAVSAAGHRWIHNNPAKATEMGFLGPTGTYNDFVRAKKSLDEVLERRKNAIKKATNNACRKNAS